MAAVETFVAEGVRGFLHLPVEPRGCGLVLTHGAGSDCRAGVLVAASEAFAAAGCHVLRCDLPFRQRRPHGPPRPAEAPGAREGLRLAVSILHNVAGGRVFFGGHSYGGRQASMVAAEDAALASGLLLLSYPLHPPRRPTQMRTAHFPQLCTPALFVHGDRDPFGSPEEMRAALDLIPGPKLLMVVPGGHELSGFHVLRDNVVRELLGGFHPAVSGI